MLNNNAALDAVNRGRVKRKAFTCEFCDVDLGVDITHTFADILDVLHSSTPAPEQRLLEREEDIFSIDDYRREGVNCSGLFVRMRKGVAPKMKGRQTIGLINIPLPDDHYVAESMAFRFYKEGNIVVIERKRDVGNYLRLAEYIRNMTPFRSLWLQPTLNASARDRLNNMRVIKAMDIKAAFPPANLGLQAEEGHSVGAIAELQTMFGGYNFELKITSGPLRSERPIHKETVVETVDYLRGPFGTKLVRGRFRGEVPGIDEDVIIDLIKDRMQEKADLEYSGSEVPTARIMQALEAAYILRKDELLGARPTSPRT